MTRSLSHRKHYRYLYLLLCGLLFVVKANAQICGMPIPENQRPDTVTTYWFTDHTLPVDQLPGAKPLSNHGFRTKTFKIKWLMIKTNDIDDFIYRSIQPDQLYLLTDTLNIRIFKEQYSGFLFKEKRTYYLLFFRRQPGRQDIFHVTFKKRKRLIPILQYLETNLQQH